MNALVWLADDTPLPHPDTALPDGLLAVGADLSVERLAEAYSKGIFPWFNPGDPVLWWSPDPRMVLTCADFSPSHSLRKKLRQLARHERDTDARITITMNTAFARVIAACAEPRSAQNSTWISPIIQQTYLAWHQTGYVHSIETWEEGELTGGLYGVGLGRFFFGESMFNRTSDASKLALAYLVNFLNHHGVRHIDCQQQTSHLASLGARPLTRSVFLTLVAQALHKPAPAWGRGQLLQAGQLAFKTS